VATPEFARTLLGWRRGIPNTADSNSAQSRGIAEQILHLLEIPGDAEGPVDPGSSLEEAVKDYLAVEMPLLEPNRPWQVLRRQRVIEFSQYEHLSRLQAIIEADTSGTLGTEIGRDYVIAPDVTVGFPGPLGMLLHAAISCKWTIRSDRVQNIRHEAVILTRHRRGRQPHIVTVTAEPLPSRLAAIARGTGEVDGVYHVAFDELVGAVSAVGTPGQQAVLEELINQHRLAALDMLPGILVL
jgi:hypothetical protein